MKQHLKLMIAPVGELYQDYALVKGVDEARAKVLGYLALGRRFAGAMATDCDGDIVWRRAFDGSELVYDHMGGIDYQIDPHGVLTDSIETRRVPTMADMARLAQVMGIPEYADCPSVLVAHAERLAYVARTGASEAH